MQHKPAQRGGAASASTHVYQQPSPINLGLPARRSCPTCTNGSAPAPHDVVKPTPGSEAYLDFSGAPCRAAPRRAALCSEPPLRRALSRHSRCPATRCPPPVGGASALPTCCCACCAALCRQLQPRHARRGHHRRRHQQQRGHGGGGLGRVPFHLPGHLPQRPALHQQPARLLRAVPAGEAGAAAGLAGALPSAWLWAGWGSQRRRSLPRPCSAAQAQQNRLLSTGTVSPGRPF